jgi:hypothetical protein
MAAHSKSNDVNRARRKKFVLNAAHNCQMIQQMAARCPAVNSRIGKEKSFDCL